MSVANQFGAPIVGITSTSLYPWYSDIVGNVMMPSYVPVNLLPFTSRMTFVERVINVFTLAAMKMFYKYKYESKVSRRLMFISVRFFGLTLWGSSKKVFILLV